MGGPIPRVDRSAALAMVNTLDGNGREHREKLLTSRTVIKKRERKRPSPTIPFKGTTLGGPGTYH